MSRDKDGSGETSGAFLTISVQLYSVSYGVALMMHVIGRRYEMVDGAIFGNSSIRGSITHILIG